LDQAYDYPMMSNEQAEQQLKRMDFDKDQRAWELAKKVAQPNEPLSDTIARAQRIKEAL
jgi:hypothetical protein